MHKHAKALYSVVAVPVLMLALGYFSIAAASLVPGEYRPPSQFLCDGMDHAVAYFMIATPTALFALPKFPKSLLLLIIAAFAGTMELCQLAIPGRTCSLSDFLGGSCGAAAGVAAAALTQWLFARVPTNPDPA